MGTSERVKKAEKALPRSIFQAKFQLSDQGLEQLVQREVVDLVKDADAGKYFCSWTQLVRSSSQMRNSKVGVAGGMKGMSEACSSQLLGIFDSVNLGHVRPTENDLRGTVPVIEDEKEASTPAEAPAVALSPEEWKEAQELLEKAKEVLTKLGKARATLLCHGYTHNVDLSLQDASKYIDKVKGNKEDALDQQLLLI